MLKKKDQQHAKCESTVIQEWDIARTTTLSIAKQGGKFSWCQETLALMDILGPVVEQT